MYQRQNKNSCIIAMLLMTSMLALVTPAGYTQSPPVEPTPSNTEFTKDVPFDEAFTNFFTAVKDAISGVIDPDAVKQWMDDTETRFDEFVSDFSSGIQEWKNSTFKSPKTDKMKNAADKWNDVADSLPGLEQMKPAVKPITEKLLKGLPELEPFTPNQSAPFSNVFNYYQAMEAENPWGQASLFQLERFDEKVVETISKSIRKQTKNGDESKMILLKEKNVTVNDKPVFFLLIKNDAVIEQTETPLDKTFMHKVLRELKEDGAENTLIEHAQIIVTAIDTAIEKSGLTISTKRNPIEVYKAGYPVQ